MYYYYIYWPFITAAITLLADVGAAFTAYFLGDLDFEATSAFSFCLISCTYSCCTYFELNYNVYYSNGSSKISPYPISKLSSSWWSLSKFTSSLCGSEDADEFDLSIFICSFRFSNIYSVYLILLSDNSSSSPFSSISLVGSNSETTFEVPSWSLSFYSSWLLINCYNWSIEKLITYWWVECTLGSIVSCKKWSSYLKLTNFGRWWSSSLSGSDSTSLLSHGGRSGAIGCLFAPVFLDVFAAIFFVNRGTCGFPWLCAWLAGTFESLPPFFLGLALAVNCGVTLRFG